MELRAHILSIDHLSNLKSGIVAEISGFIGCGWVPIYAGVELQEEDSIATADDVSPGLARHAS